MVSTNIPEPHCPWLFLNTRDEDFFTVASIFWLHTHMLRRSAGWQTNHSQVACCWVSTVTKATPLWSCLIMGRWSFIFEIVGMAVALNTCFHTLLDLVLTSAVRCVHGGGGALCGLGGDILLALVVDSNSFKWRMVSVLFCDIFFNEILIRCTSFVTLF